MEELEELNLLKEWKHVFSQPNHKIETETEIKQAQIGLIPEADKPIEWNRRLVADKLEDIGYLGCFPLVLVTLPKQNLEYVANYTTPSEPKDIQVINPKYRERSVFSDFESYKKGLISKEYFDAYVSEMK